MNDETVYQAVIETDSQREENLRMNCLHLALETARAIGGIGSKEELRELATDFYQFVKGE